MRAFVAIDVPDAGSAAGFVRSAGRAPEHLTLRFLGDLPDDRVGAVGRVIGEAAVRHRAFHLTLSRFGAFPDARRPRIVFADVGEGRAEVEALAADVDSGLATLGIAREGRPFVPHVTVLRVRSPRDVARARQLLDWEPVASLGDTWVREVLLKSSDLRPGGAVHRVVGRWALAPVGEGAEPPRGTEDGSDMVKPSSPRNFVPPSGGEEPSRPGA